MAAIVFLSGEKANAGSPSVDELAGVYKRSFQNGAVDGSTYRSEDILEIVKLSPTAAYFRTHLEFSNHHACNLWGVIEETDSGFVYHGPQSYSGKACTLHLKVDEDTITFEDEDQACRSLSCGARGAYSLPGERPIVYFDLNSRRRIRYMDRLLASWQYADALAEYEARLSGVPPKRDQ
jgi:hypothetical protein